METAQRRAEGRYLSQPDAAIASRGHIELPPPLARHTNRGSRRWHIAPVSIDCTPLRAMLRDLPSLSFRQVRRTPQEPLFNALLHKHHELGYRQPVGEHLKYLVYAGQWLVAALAWSSAAHGLTCRDRFIGWSPEARRRNRHLLAYNTRFLVPPWVQVPHLASHVLGRMARRLSADWQQLYGHPVYFLETFVDPARHRGTCYRAANWIVLGQTFGRGHRCPTSRPNRSPEAGPGLPSGQAIPRIARGRGTRVARRCEDMKPHPDVIEVDEKELQAKLHRIEEVLGLEFAKPFRQLLDGYVTVLGLLREKSISIKRLQKILFGGSSELSSKIMPEEESSSEPVTDTATGDVPAAATDVSPPAENGAAEQQCDPGSDAVAASSDATHATTRSQSGGRATDAIRPVHTRAAIRWLLHTIHYVRGTAVRIVGKAPFTASQSGLRLCV